MGLPNWGLQDLEIPDDFDPEKHCGAKRPNLNTVCMHRTPQGVRCKRHSRGNSTETQLANREKKLTGGKKFFDRVEEIKNDPNLLRLDTEIAVLRATLEIQLNQYGVDLERYEKAIQSLGAIGEMPDDVMEAMGAAMPSLKMDTIETLAKLVTAEHNMQFAKRNSIPIAQVGQMLAQLLRGFESIARRHDIPAYVVEEFSRIIRDLTLPTAMTAGIKKSMESVELPPPDPARGYEVVELN